MKVDNPPRFCWWRKLACEAAQNADLLDDWWEREFVAALLQQREIQLDQLTTLNEIIAKLRATPGHRPLVIFRPVAIRAPASIPLRERAP